MKKTYLDISGFVLAFVSLCSYKQCTEYPASYKQLPLKNFMMIFWSRHDWFCFLGEEAEIHSNRKLSTQIILKIPKTYISWDAYLSIKRPNFYSCANTTNSHCSMSCSRIIDNNCYCTLRKKSLLHILLFKKWI